MIHIIWAGLMLVSLAFSLFSGTMDVMASAIMDGAKEAVNLCLMMAAVVGLWSGIMEIGVESGVLGKISGMMNPFLRWMFPNLNRHSPAMQYIAANFAANLLGLGWAATPAGLKAMDELRKEGMENSASDEMCAFILLNVSSLQLIPLTIIVYRSQYGSAVPAAVVLPGLIATTVSTVCAVLFSKVMYHKSAKKKRR